MTDSETASFVLAYLLKNNYSTTATSFLQECTVLPSNSLMILPQTPLQSLVAEHKLRTDTTVLVNKLGKDNTWTALWDKLHTTLQQIKMVFEDGPSLKASGTPSLSQRPRVTKVRKSRPLLSSPPSSHITLDTLHSNTISPHRRKPVPRRKVPSFSPSKAPPLSPATQNLLDSLIEDTELPGKLADIINHSRDDSTSDLSPLTLDTIVERTCNEVSSSHVTQQQSQSTAMTESPPPDKKQRVNMSEQDIEHFLDQLHS